MRSHDAKWVRLPGLNAGEAPKETLGEESALDRAMIGGELAEDGAAVVVVAVEEERMPPSVGAARSKKVGYDPGDGAVTSAPRDQDRAAMPMPGRVLIRRRAMCPRGNLTPH